MSTPTNTTTKQLTPTQAQRLRSLLLTRKWFTNTDLVETLGHRFSAVLYQIRHGLDGGPPMAIETERLADGWRYRWSGAYKDEGITPRLCQACGKKLQKQAKQQHRPVAQVVRQLRPVN